MAEPHTPLRGGWVDFFDREGVTTGTIRDLGRVVWASHPPTAQQAQPEPLQQLQDDANAALPTCTVPVHGEPCGARMRWCLMQERPLFCVGRTRHFHARHRFDIDDVPPETEAAKAVIVEQVRRLAARLDAAEAEAAKTRARECAARLEAVETQAKQYAAQRCSMEAEILGEEPPREPHARPSGPAPTGKTWSYLRGKWEDEHFLKPTTKRSRAEKRARTSKRSRAQEDDDGNDDAATATAASAGQRDADNANSAKPTKKRGCAKKKRD